MPGRSCCVKGCSKVLRLPQHKFYRLPVDSQRREMWVVRIDRVGWIATTNHRVCSRHFVCGFPVDDPNDIDYVPSLFMDMTVQQHELPDDANTVCAEADSVHQEVEMMETAEAFMLASEMQTAKDNAMLLQLHGYCKNDEVSETCSNSNLCSIGTQTDMSMTDLQSMENECKNLKQQVDDKTWNVKKICDNDKLTRFYTGLPTFAVFMWLFNYLQPKAAVMKYRNSANSHRKKIMQFPLVDQMLFVLVRLRLGLTLQDLADRFNSSVSVLSNIFTTWIHLMEKELELLCPCPSREVVARTLPKQFSKYPNIRLIIDCTELHIQRASCFVAQNLTYSNYKHHTTVKFLIGIVPTGAIAFVSKAWGGRTSDRYITEHSGFLDVLNDGDLIMADKGFNIGDLLAKRKARLNIPPFLHNKRFTSEEILSTKSIANVRIHVERAIGRVKRFHILDRVVPLTMKSTIGPMFRVICYLTNLDRRLVK